MRAAGDTNAYSFVLRNKGTGKYDLKHQINFDSVTSVISSVLAKPFLVTWAFNHALDVIHGLTDHVAPELLVELLCDDEDLKTYMKANKLRPEDIRDEAADRGKEEHSHLEALATTYLESDPLDADHMAERFLRSDNGFRRATGQWWLDTSPKVLASEAFVYSLKHRFAGTADLVLEDRVVVDLKSRRSGLGMYDSDDIQVGAYLIAYNEMTGRDDWPNPDRYVLIIHEDGTYKYEEATIDPTTFLDLLQVYRKLKG